MSTLFSRLRGGWKELHLADRLLLIFLAVLLLQAGHNLFAHELSGNVQQLDVVVRTTAAAIFGYFVSGGAQGRQREEISSQTPGKIGFSLPEEVPLSKGDSSQQSRVEELLPAPVEGGGEERGALERQMMIVGLIGLAALGLLVLARNCGQTSAEAQATLSQLRDFVSGSVGFLIGHGGGKLSAR